MPLRRLHRILIVALVVCSAATTLHGQWKRVPLPGKYDLGYYLDVFFLPGDDRFGWACSLDGYAIRTTDGGLTWRGSDIGEVFFEHIQFLNRFVGYTSGSNGIFKSTDGGATWFDVTPTQFFQTPDKGWGCYFINDQEGFWFVGGCGSHVQQFYRTTNGGFSWEVYFAFENNTGLTDGFVNDNGEGFAVSSGTIWRTTDRGRTWRVHARTPRNAWTEEITKINGSWLLPISGSTCDGEPRDVGSLMFTTDDARTWRVFETGAAMFGSFLLDERRGWGVGDNGACYYTEDAGATWQLRNCGLEGVSLDDIWFVRDTLGWIAGAGLFRSNFNAIPKVVSIDAPDTIAICLGDSVPLTANDGLRSYRWNVGGQSRSIMAGAVGRYIITAIDPETCVESEDTVVITERPSRTPQISTTGSAPTRCEGDTVTLTIENAPFVRYRWSTGDTASTIKATRTGTYVVDVLDTTGCWKRSAPIALTFVPLPEAEITLSGPTTFCLDDSVVIGVKGTYAGYQWSNGATTPTITVREPGTFFVVVITDIGCIDTSATVAVDVIRTRNKIDLASVARPFVVQDHDVGDRACTDLRIRNRSTDEPLVIARPYLVHNVVFGIPAAQLPIVIPPGGEDVLTICCATADTGAVDDTLYLPDTCSPSVIPLRSRGRPYDLFGDSRCNVATQVTVIRAGIAYRINAPFPNPSDQGAMLNIMMPRGLPEPEVRVMDAMLREVSVGRVADVRADGTDTSMLFEIPTSALPNGAYMVMISDRTGLRHGMVMHVLH